MLLPHFSQSEAIRDEKLGELLGPKYSTMEQLSFFCKRSGELPRAQTCIVVSRTTFSYLTTFAWWAPHGPKIFLDRFSPLAYPMRHAYWFLIEISFKQKVASIPQPSLKISEVSPKHPRLVAFPKPSNVIVDINSEISAPNFNILISRCLVC